MFKVGRLREAKIAEEGGLSNNVVPYFGKQGRERLFFCTELHSPRFYVYFCAEFIGFLNLFSPPITPLFESQGLTLTQLQTETIFYIL